MKRAVDRPARERLISALGVVAVHGAVGLILVGGLGTSAPIAEPTSLAVFDISVPPPPPMIEPEPRSAADPRDKGAAAPPALEAVSTPIVAPPSLIPRPSPIVAAPVAGAGSQATAGAASVPGPGTGGGGVGTGTGSGRGGDGQGGGGGSRAEKTTGAILDRDYPRAARRIRAQGSVTTRFTVGVDGRARDCAVTTSSGNAELDATTCRLIEQRFRYLPARGAGGEPIAEARGWRQDWWLERRE